MALGQQLGWIGVDVGTHTVKLAQVARHGGGARLHRAAVIQRPTSWSSDDRLALDQPASSGAEIAAARDGGAFSGRNAVCTLPMNICELRGLAMPPGEEDERRAMIEDALAAEWAERQVPMEFDFWELESGKVDKGSDGFNVEVLAVGRPWIAQVVRDCRQAGLDCWSLDGVPLAMSRAVGLVGAVTSGRRSLAVDWGFSNTTLCVVGDGRPLYVRRVTDCAFGQALDAVVNEFLISLDEAQHLADIQGVLPLAADDGANGDRGIQAAMTRIMEDTIEKLVGHIRRTLHFLEAQRRQLHPSDVWLMGGGASLRNIAPRLAAELHLPVNLWRMASDGAALPCADGNRSSIFASAAALSALAWRSA